MSILDDGDSEERLKKILNNIQCKGYHLLYHVSKKKTQILTNTDKSMEKAETIPLMYLGKELGELAILDGKIDGQTLIILSLFLYSHYITNESKNLSRSLNKKSKNMFVANVSHELRTPLNSIIGMLNILQDTPLTDDQQGYLDIVRESSFNLLTLINELLDISKLEAGCMQLKYGPMNIADALKSISVITKSEKKIDVSYIENINKDVPPTILADEQHFKQIMINLLSNAFKYTKTGHVELSVDVLPKEEAKKMFPLICDNTILEKKNIERTFSETTDLTDKTRIGEVVYLKIAITDTGIGIKEQDYDKLFKIFSQVDTSTSKTHKGTGLGLVLVEKLVTLMNGYIGFDSVYRKGSTFYCVIPFQVYNAEDDPKIDFSLFEDCSVLIVDDNESNIISICSLLEKYGINHKECTSSRMALLTYLNNPNHHFDIGLFDICMPNMDGNELINRITPERLFPVIALSSLGARVGTINPKFTAHLTKPFKSEDLLRLMTKIMKNNKKRGSPSKRKTFINKFQSDTYYCTMNPSPRVKFSMHILVVEDDHNNCVVIKKMLLAIGFTNIKIVHSGHRAIKTLFLNMVPNADKKYTTKSKYDIILMDIVMPRMDGVETTRRIFKKFNDRSLAPIVIAVTANVMPSDVESYFKHGFLGYVAKPILERTTIYDAINDALSR